MAASQDLDALVGRIRACRICVERPFGAPLPHEPRPVLQISASARLLVAGQAPGTRVHATGAPFNDPSGDRLRGWIGLSREQFYDPTRVAVVAMGFCYPGRDAKGADLPPRRECRASWHDELFRLAPQIETIFAVGRAAQDYHSARLGRPLPVGASLEKVIRICAAQIHLRPHLLALPHPSWRNNAWLQRRPWFEREIAPLARELAAEAITGCRALKREV
ncbi:uracil-DNA glycosylase family protein [Rhodoblastus sp.]|uniref:uracil-DNA glycosylase family protein n=1 Tax=Rhodoblastus sp. TaxID=1962975 RepID=UPI0026149B43|nr:uracil-DNA glycosylase family protein [Rhodoblastus sp.]